jgi:hypothetical protein
MVKAMKKLVVIFMAIALCACLFVGCEGSADEKYWAGSGFVYIESKGHLDYLYYEETGVMYVYDDYSAYAGGLAPLFNADGTPMIWEGN